MAKCKAKVFLVVMFVLFVLVSIAIYIGVAQTPQNKHGESAVAINGVYLTKPQRVDAFELTDNHHKPFTKDSLMGHWTFMFFGFTNCAMVCPTTLEALNKMYQTLQKELPANQLPQIVMVSVDPDRDTVERMNDYVISFNSAFIGTRAEIKQTVALEKQFHIVAAKMQADGQGKNHYSINHSAEILIFNPNAELQAFLSYPHDPAQMVKDYRLILKVYR